MTCAKTNGIAFKLPAKLVAIDDRGKQHIPLIVNIEGEVIEDVQIHPPRLVLGARAQGDNVEETVYLKSARGKRFSVQDIKVRSAEIARVTPIMGNDAAHLPISYKIMISTAHKGSLKTGVEFLLNIEGRSASVLLPVYYYGIDAITVN